MRPVAMATLQPGDVFVQGGSPGHAVLDQARAVREEGGGGVRCVRWEGFCSFARCMRATRLVLATVVGVIGACASADGACLLCHVWL